MQGEEADEGDDVVLDHQEVTVVFSCPFFFKLENK
jgi:hypothetical protein